MLIIQVILIPIIGLFCLRLLYQVYKKQINFSQFITWLAVGLTAIVVIAYPKITSYLADRVGIGRGVDLVIYVSILVIFYLLYRLLMRIEKMEKNITNLVRQDALKDE